MRIGLLPRVVSTLRYAGDLRTVQIFIDGLTGMMGNASLLHSSNVGKWILVGTVGSCFDDTGVPLQHGNCS